MDHVRYVRGVVAVSADGEPGLLARLVPSVLRSSLALKFGLALLALGIVTAGVSAFATGEIVSQTRENVNAEFSSVAADEAATVEQWVKRHRQTTTLLSRSANWRTYDPDNMRIRLQSRRSMSGMADDIAALHVLTSSGNGSTVYASTGMERGTSFAAERPWISSIELEQTNQVTRSSVYSVDGEDRIAFVSPVGEDERLFVLETDTGPITTSLTGASRSEQSLTQVVDQTNRVVLSNRRGGDGQASVSGDVYATEDARDPLQRARETGEAGVIADMPANEFVFDETYAVGYAPVDNVDGWVVAVHAPRSSVFGFVQSVATWGYGAMAASLLALVVFGIGLAYHVTSPINRLRERTERIREGDLGTDLTTSRTDEIGALFEDFDEMREDVRRKMLDAEEARHDAQAAQRDAEQLADHLQQKADEYGRVMEECATGDLTRRLDADSESESMRQIAENFNEMVAELEKTVGQLQDFSDEVAEGGAVVRDGAESVSDASQQVATSIQRISDDLQDQRNRLESIASEVRDATATVQETTATGDVDPAVREQLERFEAIAADVEELTEITNESLDEAENVAVAAEEQTSALDEVSHSAGDMIRYAEPLGEVLNRFKTSANQEFFFPVGPGSDAETPQIDDTGATDEED